MPLQTAALGRSSGSASLFLPVAPVLTPPDQPLHSPPPSQHEYPHMA